MISKTLERKCRRPLQFAEERRSRKTMGTALFQFDTLNFIKRNLLQKGKNVLKIKSDLVTSKKSVGGKDGRGKGLN